MVLPPEFGNWNSVYRYFCRLQQKGILEKIFKELSKAAEMEEVSVDSTFVKVHRHGTGAKKGLHIGKSKGSNTTKIHVFADKYARAVNIVLSAGNVNDITVAPILLEGTALSVIMGACVKKSVKRPAVIE